MSADAAPLLADTANTPFIYYFFYKIRRLDTDIFMKKLCIMDRRREKTYVAHYYQVMEFNIKNTAAWPTPLPGRHHWRCVATYKRKKEKD